MTNVVEVKLPRRMHTCRVLLPLRVRKRIARGRAMNRDGHHSGRPVRKPDVGACESDLHEVLRKIARRMSHSLMSSRDVDAGRVVVRPEMRAPQSSVRYVEKPREE